VPWSVPTSGSVTFYLYPDAGYRINTLLVDSVAATPSAGGSYTFDNVGANHTIAVSFIPDTYDIVPSAGANGSISPATTQTVAAGSNQTFTITPNSGFAIAGVLVDGASVGAVSTYTFTNVTTNHTISATFGYTIVPTAQTGGSISPNTTQTVAPGANATFTISVNTGYHATDVVVDGVSKGIQSTYTFVNVQANHTIAALFARDAVNYVITPSTSAGGSIFPNVPFTVPSGGSVTFSFTPDAGYRFDHITVDGVTTATAVDDGTYTFSLVNANHTIAAFFVANTYTIVPTAQTGGSISPATTQTVAAGANATFTISATAGYHATDVVVDGVSKGILSTYTFVNVQANHTIAALFARDAVNYVITPSVVGTGGAISPAIPFTVPSGGSVTFSFTPATGYRFDHITVDGVTTATAVDDGTYTFTNVTANHAIAAFFVANPTSFTIVPSAGANGSISPATTQTVAAGANATFTITPAAGYHVGTLSVDGTAVTAATSYVFTNVQANHTISVTFVANVVVSFTITPTAGPGGSFSPATAQTVASGSNAYFTATAAIGYHLSTVTVDGVAVTPTAWGLYVFTNVTANHTISATFVADQVVNYTITPSAGAGGSISPATAQIVASGGSATFAMTPATGYHIATLTVDGHSVTPVNSYSFANVTANHTIAATFAFTKLPTGTTLSYTYCVSNHWITLTANLTGGTGTFTNTYINFEKRLPNATYYVLAKTVKVSSTGVAIYKYKITAKGTRYHRVRFLGNDTLLPSPVLPGLKLVVK
jgi:hypothetical protein